MEQLLYDELQFIALLVSNRPILLNYIYESKLVFKTSSLKTYCVFQNEETKKCWKQIVKAIADDKDVKTVFINQIRNFNLPEIERKKIWEILLYSWKSNVDSTKINSLYLNLKRNTEIHIATHLIQSFQNNMFHKNASLLEACDFFFMECPLNINSDFNHLLIGENSQIYWNNQRVFDSILELEHELRKCKELNNIRWVLNCSIRSQGGVSNHSLSIRLKQIMQELGLEILNVNRKY